MQEGAPHSTVSLSFTSRWLCHQNHFLILCLTTHPPTLCGCKGERSHQWVLTDALDLRSCHQASHCDSSAWPGAPFPQGTHSAGGLVVHCQAQSQATDVADRYTAPGPFLGPRWVRLKPTPLSAHPALPSRGSRGHGSRGRDPFWGQGRQGEMGQQKCSMCSQL